MRHASLVADESGQMDGLGGVILGERLDLSAMAGGTLLGVERHGAMPRRRELTVRLKREGIELIKMCASKFEVRNTWLRKTTIIGEIAIFPRILFNNFDIEVISYELIVFKVINN